MLIHSTGAEGPAPAYFVRALTHLAGIKILHVSSQMRKPVVKSTHRCYFFLEPMFSKHPALPMCC